MQRARSIRAAGAIREPSPCVSSAGDACAAISVWAALAPRRIRESADRSHHLARGRPDFMAADDDAVGRVRITQAQEKESGQAMSQSFRAVKEIWNVHSSCFIEAEKVIVLLHDLTVRVGTTSDEHEYGDKHAVWPGNGRKALDYMEADERFSAASFKDSMEEQGVTVNKDDLITLIGNMRSLSKQWRSSIGKHGELLFYIDVC